MKRFLSLVLCMMLLATCVVTASAKTKTISNSRTYYSWCGIKIFTTGVKGWYDTNGSRITSYNNTTSTPKCHFMWTSSNRGSWWTSTTNKTTARCYGEAKFALGLTTDQFTVGFQQGYYGVTATGNAK